MPAPIWPYLTALLHFAEVSTCLAIAQVLEMPSHDRLTRMLWGQWSGQTPLELALRALFTVVGGYLIVDDTIVEKPQASLLEEATWVWSTKHNKVVFGIPFVLLVWTNGRARIPLAFRIWRKGGPSKFDLALELLSPADAAAGSDFPHDPLWRDGTLCAHGDHRGPMPRANAHRSPSREHKRARRWPR
jgi:hypothetical protein